mmetsp:Transcript_4548/g.18732  ORF Transcript_4548/g.18732 Transcript_4548/m.18732 type:complete len:292 (+) Transcript_4548:2240-3115(+)
MTAIALRCVFSSLARISRASFDSGQASFPSFPSEALARSRSSFRTPKKSFATRVSCADPASHSGFASGEVMYMARDTEFASFATLRSAAPSLAPMSRDTTACERLLMSSLGSPPNVSSGVRGAPFSFREMVMRPSASRPGPRPLSSGRPSRDPAITGGDPTASFTMPSLSFLSDAAAAAAVSITSASIASAALAIGAIIAASASSRETSSDGETGVDEAPATRSANISFSISSSVLEATSKVSSPEPEAFPPPTSSVMRSHLTLLSCSLRNASRIALRPSGVAGAIALRIA